MVVFFPLDRKNQGKIKAWCRDVPRGNAQHFRGEWRSQCGEPKKNIIFLVAHFRKSVSLSMYSRQRTRVSAKSHVSRFCLLGRLRHSPRNVSVATKLSRVK